MKLTDIITGAKPSLSFEVFPPKTWETYDQIRDATEEIASLHPSYMSVTYGAGGGTSDYTVSIAENIQKKHGVPTIAHLTCISSSREQVKKQLSKLKDAGITNILALRGDLPKDGSARSTDYSYSSQLIKDIIDFGGFCIGGACYPEGHPDSKTWMDDVKYLKVKVDAGCEFLTTQMFFDNNILYNFLYRIREAGINVPVVAGIMPVTNAVQIKRICAISGNALPQRFIRIADKFGNDPRAMMQAGIAYATAQVIDLLANGINAVHIYSMNKPEVARQIKENLTGII
ncbi:MAG: methylenetetrahydrofolate reductase [Oscillospiraceae bacterium]|nr:methylenetetrahydrofolate reductase [NAD(P)H] [Oscillospiraceae bacterium]